VGLQYKNVSNTQKNFGCPNATFINDLRIRELIVFQKPEPKDKHDY
jgi:hypothetical protein